MNTIYLAGLERGLTKKDMQHMTVGELVDFIQAWNLRQKKAEDTDSSSKPVKKYKLATPQETSAYHRG